MQINMNQTVVQMVEGGLLTFDQVKDLIVKNQRKQKRYLKKARMVLTKAKVSETLETLLKKPGSTVKHRTVWLNVGRHDFTRDEVLNALRELRTEGILQNIKTSNNNFQVFWAYTQQPATPLFGTITDASLGKVNE